MPGIETCIRKGLLDFPDGKVTKNYLVMQVMWIQSPARQLRSCTPWGSQASACASKKRATRHSSDSTWPNTYVLKKRKKGFVFNDSRTTRATVLRCLPWGVWDSGEDPGTPECRGKVDVSWWNTNMFSEGRKGKQPQDWSVGLCAQSCCIRVGENGFHLAETEFLTPPGISTKWASLVAQRVKNLPIMQQTWVWYVGWEGPLEEGMANHSSILAWRIP